MNTNLIHLSPESPYKSTNQKNQSFNNNKDESGYVDGGDMVGQNGATDLSPTGSKDSFLSLSSPGSVADSPPLNSSVPNHPPGKADVQKAHFLIGNGGLKRSKVNNGGSSLSVSSDDEGVRMGQDGSPWDSDKGGPTSGKGKVAQFPSPLLARSQEENFECLADGSQAFFDSAQDSSLQYSREGNEWCGVTAGSSSSLPFRRNSLLRSSLRKSPQNNNNGDGMGLHRRVGSFRNPSGTKRPQVIAPVTSSSALTASQLYRTSSFNSSGRSSAGDVEEMYSDGSLEDEVIDLTQKYHHLEEKFSVLAENQSTVDDRYARAKQENVELSTKLFMVEEQIRDVEARGEERLREEQRRFKESLARLEREKELELANAEIRLQATQKELEGLKAETVRLKGQVERERSDRSQQLERLLEAERELGLVRDENRKLLDEARADRDALTLESIGSQQALIDLKREFDSLRKYQMVKSAPTAAITHRESIDAGDVNELYSRLNELEEENRRVKNENRDLREANDDLMAQVLSHGLEEGRQLLSQRNGMENSLAAEFEAMSQDQMKSALKEQKEVNDQLKTYIDNILLSIVENYPQLLEVKNKCPSSSDSKRSSIES